MFEASGKMILLGEHAVVHDSRAIAGRVGFKLRGRTVPSETPGLRIDPIESVESWNSDHPMIRAIRQIMGVEPSEQRCLHIEGDLIPGVGLGFSASLAYVVAQWVCSVQNGDNASEDQATEFAAELENYFHGGASGIDLAAIVSKSPIVFRKGTSPVKLDGKLNAWISGAVFPVEQSTKELVAGVRQRAQDSEDVRLALHKIAALVEEGVECFQQGNRAGFAELMNRNQLHLETLGVSFQSNRAAVAAALEAGAEGAKLSGAGGGGLVIALSSSREKAEYIQSAMTMIPDQVALGSFVQKI